MNNDSTSNFGNANLKMSLRSASPEASLSKISYSTALLISITPGSELQNTQQNPRPCVSVKCALVGAKMSVKFQQWEQNIQEFSKCVADCRI